MPIVAIAPCDDLYDKMVSNIEQVKAREGSVVAVVVEGDDLIGKADHTIPIPCVPRLLWPILTVIPLQLGLRWKFGNRRDTE